MTEVVAHIALWNLADSLLLHFFIVLFNVCLRWLENERVHLKLLMLELTLLWLVSPLSAVLALDAVVELMTSLSAPLALKLARVSFVARLTADHALLHLGIFLRIFLIDLHQINYS
jgi:hypothetical protein